MDMGIDDAGDHVAALRLDHARTARDGDLRRRSDRNDAATIDDHHAVIDILATDDVDDGGAANDDPLGPWAPQSRAGDRSSMSRRSCPAGLLSPPGHLIPFVRHRHAFAGASAIGQC